MNRRYFWLKLKENFFESDDMKIIESQKNGAEYIIFWQKLLLKAITSKEVGVLRYKENIPYTPEILSTITGTNIDVTKGALKLFMELGMIDITQNGDIIIDEFIQELIGSETEVAKRVRKHREKKDLLQCNEMKQISNTEIEIEKEIEKEILYKSKFFVVTKEQHNTYKKAYPNINILSEYDKMTAWLISNPTKQKKQYKRFINSWLGRAKSTPTEQTINDIKTMEKLY
ncbi:MAG: hypothetical protein GY853_00545 [PVC group bacterium]|nr:hypothetical protein [PVC group bacterium]